jgi:predicted PurR-regulated permease PerM
MFTSEQNYGFHRAIIRKARMNWIHKQTASILFTIVAFTLLLTSIYLARQPLTAFIFAILFAYLLNPIVGQFQNLLRCSRGKGVFVTYVVLAIAVAGVGVTAGPRIVREVITLGKELPALMEDVGSGQIAQDYGTRHRWDIETRIGVQQFLASHRDAMAKYTQDAVNRVAGLAGNMMWLVLIPVMAAFLLKNPARFSEDWLGLIRKNQDRELFRSLLKYLDAMLARFIRAQLKFAALGMAAYTGFLLAVGFPYALAAGAIAGLLEFIPFVGPLISCVLIMGMAILMGYPHWLLILVFLAIWRAVQDYITSPYLMGRGVKLHPLAVIVGVLAGGEIAGVAGMFLAVPILGSMRVLWTAWRLEPEVEERFIVLDDQPFPVDSFPLGSPSSTMRSEASASVKGTLGV